MVATITFVRMALVLRNVQERQCFRAQPSHEYLNFQFIRVYSLPEIFFRPAHSRVLVLVFVALWTAMASSLNYFSIPQRGNGYGQDKARLTNGLPKYSSAVQEKMHRHTRSMSWTVPVSVPIPGVRTRRLRLFVPNPTRMQPLGLSRIGRRRGPLVVGLLLVASLCVFFSFARKFGPEEKQWTPPFGESSTLIFGREDLQRVWEWEIASGHYPSKRESKSSVVPAGIFS